MMFTIALNAPFLHSFKCILGNQLLKSDIAGSLSCLSYFFLFEKKIYVNKPLTDLTIF